MNQIEHEQLKQIVREVVSESHQSIAAVQSNMFSQIDKNLNGHGKISKLIRTDVGATIALIVFISSIITPYFLIKTNIAVIDYKLDNVIKDSKEISKELSEHMKLSNQLISNLDSRVSKVEGVLGRKL